LANKTAQVELGLHPDAFAAGIDHASGTIVGLACSGAGGAAAVRPGTLGKAHRLVHAARVGRGRAGVGRGDHTVLRAKRAPGPFLLVVGVLERHERVPGTPVVHGRVVVPVNLHLELGAVVADSDGTAHGVPADQVD